MKRKVIGLLLAVLLSAYMFSGCFGLASLAEPYWNGWEETYTFKDYAVVNQPKDGKYIVNVYALYEFPGELSEEEIEKRIEGDNERFSIDWNYEWTDGEGEDYLGYGYIEKWYCLQVDQQKGTREVIIGGPIYGYSDDLEENYMERPRSEKPIQAGDVCWMLFENTDMIGVLTNKSSEAKNEIVIEKDHIMEKNAAGRIISGGEAINANMKQAIMEEKMDRIWF